ncbi:hypothetical protein Sgly_0871 [Syntrophobotulus glycolicus DSM 8271]|uniref:Uncharacterized protein n=1 Tax=Syntrophobotulus glycolicus (strain DSM 8271 / FlGlyR) TaxID=645991 RepID=F0T1V5_SYNGF|nr:hypothetical protein [Syntrophobotulus glycolicus]ADY55219.1 hypothetical protein Sgly_0871 [Syntrophobotulus glycolicus DSM 8271]
MISIISAITQLTVSTVTTATSLAARFGLIVTITLIALLISKQLTEAVSMNSATSELTLSGLLDRVLNVGIVPLLMVFVSIVFVKILHVL